VQQNLPAVWKRGPPPSLRNSPWSSVRLDVCSALSDRMKLSSLWVDFVDCVDWADEFDAVRANGGRAGLSLGDWALAR